MNAGKRDTLVTLQRYTTATDAFGAETQTWGDIGTEFCAVFYGRGDERRQAAMEQGSQAATFQMLAGEVTRALTVRDRIVSGGTWDITGIVPHGRGLIEVTATRAT